MDYVVYLSWVALLIIFYGFETSAINDNSTRNVTTCIN